MRPPINRLDSQQRLRELEAENAALKAENAELQRRLAQLEHELQRIRQRRKRTAAQRPPTAGTPADRRRSEHRQHPGSLRPQPPPGTVFVEHDVHPQRCAPWGSADLEATGACADPCGADIPEPKIEGPRYRHHLYRCRQCQQTCPGRGALELPGSHIGTRARLLTCCSRVHLGISPGKTQNLLHDFFGLTVSRAGLLGHLRWGGDLFAPVLAQLWELLRQSPVVQGDETGWRSNGEVAWAWCFRDPRRALFLLERHRNREVRVRAPGESFAGTLVSDFYSVYNGLACRKQRCLVPLLRERAKLREALPWQSVRAFMQPLLDLFQEALQLGRDRDRRGVPVFARARQALRDRLDDLMLTQTRQRECVRIWRRLYRHGDALFTFLEEARVPPDNKGSERDIRSLAAARNDGGTPRAAWSAAAFAHRKSIVVTGMKNGVRFIQYGIEVVRATLRGERLPLPLANSR